MKKNKSKPFKSKARGKSKSKWGASSLFWAALALSLFTVGLGLVLRWDDSQRLETVTRIALSNPSIEEAAYLFKTRSTTIKDVTDNSIVYLTRDLVVVDEDGDFNLEKAGTGNVYLEHSIDRAELERELDRSFSKEDIALEAQDYPVSLRSSAIFSYAAVEVVIFFVVFSVLLLAFHLLGLSLWIVPIVGALSAALLVAVKIYSPVFFDASFVIQRVAVDSAAAALMQNLSLVFWGIAAVTFFKVLSSLPLLSQTTKVVVSVAVFGLFGSLFAARHFGYLDRPEVPAQVHAVLEAPQRLSEPLYSSELKLDVFAQKKK